MPIILNQTRKTAALGGLLGAGAVVGSLFALGSVASAADSAVASDHEAPVVALISDIGEEDFAAYDACLERELGIDFEHFDDDIAEPSDLDWDAADKACESELPEGVEVLTLDEADLIELDGWIEVGEGEVVQLIEG